MLEIVEICPPLPSKLNFLMLESFTITMILKYGESIKDLRPQVWTNAITKMNCTGKWHSIDMKLIKKDEVTKIYSFCATCVLTGQGSYEFTTRIGFLTNTFGGGEENGSDDEIEAWKWAGGFGDNGKIVVHPPNNKMSWTKGPQAIEVFPQVYVGNYIAASNAKDLGFTAVLNMSIELEDFYLEEDKILYKKIGLLDGANNSISDCSIQEAVQWIDNAVKQNHKVLIHCRAGLGRSGSIGIAYLFYMNPDWTFKETLNSIQKLKPEIYPHKDLEKTLERTFIRYTKSSS